MYMWCVCVCVHVHDCVCVCVCYMLIIVQPYNSHSYSASGTAVLLDHERQEVDMVLGEVSLCILQLETDILQVLELYVTYYRSWSYM